MAITITSPSVNSLLNIGTGTYVRDALEPAYTLSSGEDEKHEVAFPMWVSLWVEAESDDSTSMVVTVSGSNANDGASGEVVLATVVAAANDTTEARVDLFVPYRWLVFDVLGGGAGEAVIAVRDRDYHRSE